MKKLDKQEVGITGKSILQKQIVRERYDNIVKG